MSEATVQGPVAPVLDSLTGERHDIHVASPVSNLLNFNSISIPIDAQVNPKLKPKIWANEFIEFGSLLKRGISEPSYHIAVRSGSVSQSNPTLSLEPTTLNPDLFRMFKPGLQHFRFLWAYTLVNFHKRPH